MRELSYGQAIGEALREEMERDARVFVAGEGVGVSIMVNPHAPTFGLLEHFGRQRVKDTPVSEAAIAGLAVGAAAMGLRPVVEIMFAPFLTLASDQIVNHAAKLRYLSGGLTSFPLVVRVKVGAGTGAGCQHAHNLEGWFTHVPGLKVVMPATAADAKGLLKAAIRDDNPVLFLEDMLLYSKPGPVPEGEHVLALGRAAVQRRGDDVTIVAWSKMLPAALEAALLLDAAGVSAEVIDPRTLLPLDKEAIVGSVRRTGRLVVVHEATLTGGFGGEIAALVAEEAWDSLKAAPHRVAAPDIPVPFSPPLAQFYLPQPARIARAVQELVARQGVRSIAAP
jgi:pyruvate/2-oxoglutarate/acetoin dehydrogenase E1 component